MEVEGEVSWFGLGLEGEWQRLSVRETELGILGAYRSYSYLVKCICWSASSPAQPTQFGAWHSIPLAPEQAAHVGGSPMVVRACRPTLNRPNRASFGGLSGRSSSC